MKNTILIKADQLHRDCTGLNRPCVKTRTLVGWKKDDCMQIENQSFF